MVARRWSAGHAVLREESERPIQPRLVPPLPAKTVTLTGPHQMVPNLLFDPVANVGEASARVANGKVLHPAPQHRVDFRNHLADGPGPMAAENLLERTQQRRPLFPPRGAQRHPSVSPTANPTEVKAEKSEALALRQVHPPSLLLVHLDVERRQYLTESPFDRRAQPVPRHYRVQAKTIDVGTGPGPSTRESVTSFGRLQRFDSRCRRARPVA